MIPIEQLLAPVSGVEPTGRDASVTGLLLELEGLIEGKVETQFSPAEAPNWRALLARCLEAAASTKDLRVGAILTATLLRTEGLSGLHQGLQLLRGYLQIYGEAVHPRLDPSDGNDPQVRVNALSNLAAPVATDGDLLRIVEELRRTPLVNSPETGSFGVTDWLAAKSRNASPDAANGSPTLAIIEGARSKTSHDKIAANASAASGCLAELTAIAAIYDQAYGPSNVPAFEPLRRELKNIVTWIGNESAARPPENGGGVQRIVTAPHAALSGDIESREDVIRALDAIIQYYKLREPSSPIPFLLHRVRRLVPLDFMQLMREISPESIERLRVLTGPAETTGSA